MNEKYFPSFSLIFSLLLEFLKTQRYFNEMQFIYFVVVACAFIDAYEKPWPNLESWKFMLLVSSKSITV